MYLRTDAGYRREEPPKKVSKINLVPSTWYLPTPPLTDEHSSARREIERGPISSRDPAETAALPAPEHR